MRGGQNRIDLTGNRYGTLTVMGYAVRTEMKSSASRSAWLCKCDCGAERIIQGDKLRAGRSFSCFECRNISQPHGKVGSRTYASWSAMKLRCLNRQYGRFADYGGRGITICDRWMKFENFLADMGERPEGATLDRIDNEGNYEPGNCRWATVAEQNRNQRARKRGMALSRDQAREVRAALVAGETPRVLALRYGVSCNAIREIRRGATWKSLGSPADSFVA